MEPRNLFNENFVDCYPRNLSSTKLRRCTVSGAVGYLYERLGPCGCYQYCTSEEYQSEKAHLELRFQKSRTIPEAHSLHTFIPKSNVTLSTEVLLINWFKRWRVTKQPEDFEIEQVSGYVTCVHESVWWLAYVLEKDLEMLKSNWQLMKYYRVAHWNGVMIWSS